MSARRNRTENARQRFGMIEKFIESDQSPKQFCLQEEVHYGTFQYWLKRYRNQSTSVEKKQPPKTGFVPLTFSSSGVSGDSHRYTIEYRNGVVLHIRQPIELPLLIQLIRAQEN
jgi:hypothetical protein